jgi:hypothetical protein
MRRISRVIQTVRDVVLIGFSLLLISAVASGSAKEAANYLVAFLSSGILVLTATNLTLNALKVKKKGFFYGNSVFQLVLGFFFLGLFAPLGLVYVLFNFAVIASLWEKKTPEEQLKHPTKPVTIKHRILVACGLLAMLASAFLSWFSVISFSIMGLYTRTANMSAVSQTVASSTFAPTIGLLTILGWPILMIIGSLGLLRLRFASISGGVAVALGAGWIVVLSAVIGPGPFVLIVSGVILLSARFLPSKSHAKTF